MEETRITAQEKTGLPAVLADVTERVRYYSRRSAADMLELGKALTEAKELVPRGEWPKYEKENAGMEIRTAQNFMQAYKKWGSGNETVSGLSVGQIIALLPASADEIQALAAENDIGSMSSREIKKAIQAAREEEQEKTREAVAAEKINAAKMAESAARKAANDTRAEMTEQMECLKAELEEQKKAARALKDRAEEAESRERDATQVAIEASKGVSAETNKLREDAAKLAREIADKDELIRDLQEQYDQVERQLHDTQSAIQKGDAERSDADILSAVAVHEAVNLFLSQVGRVPYMHVSFAMMDGRELENYRESILQVKDWAAKSMEALETVNGIGGIVE